MKTFIKNIILTCILALVAMACTKDEIDTFSGVDTLYFQWAIDGKISEGGIKGPKLDSVAVSFAYDFPEVTDSIFMVPVKMLGNVSSTDRPFKIKVLSTSTAVEGVHFNLPQNLVVPADSIKAMVPITLLRTPEMQNEPVSVRIGLEPNEHFDVNYFGTTESLDTQEPIKYNELEIVVSDILQKPTNWSPFMDYYLGDFSVKKLILYAQVNNIPIPDWNNSFPDIGTFFGRKNVLKAYLLEQKNNGTPVLEDDGTEMKLGPYA